MILAFTTLVLFVLCCQKRPALNDLLQRFWRHNQILVGSVQSWQFIFRKGLQGKIFLREGLRQIVQCCFYSTGLKFYVICTFRRWNTDLSFLHCGICDRNICLREDASTTFYVLVSRNPLMFNNLIKQASKIKPSSFSTT